MLQHREGLKDFSICYYEINLELRVYLYCSEIGAAGGSYFIVYACSPLSL